MKLLIENGLVFDGSGRDGVEASVVVENGVVRGITDGATDRRNADHVVDARGKWVMPGFLDTHTHYDAEVLAGPGLPESVRHGVTTVCMGSCSLSTILSGAEDCADLFSRVEALPRDEVLRTLTSHKTWSNPGEYARALEQRALGPNVACYLGHSDMRARVMGLGRSVDPDEVPSETEHEQMADYLNAALDAGFMGLSTMTNPWDKVGGERYRSSKLPSTYASWGEYRRLHRILRERGRILQSAPNITTKYNVFAFLAESAGFGVRKPLKTTLITAADTKADPWISDVITDATAAWNRSMRADLRWQTVPMPFEVYADGMDLVVFEEFGAGEAALHLADELERNDLLKDEGYRRWFRKNYEAKWTPRVWHRDFYDATIVDAPDRTLAGKSIGSVADERGIHPVDAFLDLVVAYGTKLRWKTTIANHRPEKLARMATHDAVHVSFADSGAHVRNMAFYNFAIAYLKMVEESRAAGRPMISTGQAVRKLTGELADWHGLDAGYIRLGDRADIVVVDPDGLDDAVYAYHEAPMDMMGGLQRMVRRNDRAVTATIIAGEVVFEHGAFCGGYGLERRYGSFLRHGERIAPPSGQPVARAA